MAAVMGVVIVGVIAVVMIAAHPHADAVEAAAEAANTGGDVVAEAEAAVMTVAEHVVALVAAEAAAVTAAIDHVAAAAAAAVLAVADAAEPTVAAAAAVWRRTRHPLKQRKKAGVTTARRLVMAVSNARKALPSQTTEAACQQVRVACAPWHSSAGKKKFACC